MTITTTYFYRTPVAYNTGGQFTVSPVANMIGDDFGATHNTNTASGTSGTGPSLSETYLFKLSDILVISGGIGFTVNPVITGFRATVMGLTVSSGGAYDWSVLGKFVKRTDVGGGNYVYANDGGVLNVDYTTGVTAQDIVVIDWTDVYNTGLPEVQQSTNYITSTVLSGFSSETYYGIGLQFEVNGTDTPAHTFTFQGLKFEVDWFQQPTVSNGLLSSSGVGA